MDKPPNVLIKLVGKPFLSLTLGGFLFDYHAKSFLEPPAEQVVFIYTTKNNYDYLLVFDQRKFQIKKKKKKKLKYI